MRLALLLMLGLAPVLSHSQAVTGFSRHADGVEVALSEGTLHIVPLSDRAVRIRYETGTRDSLPELILTSRVPPQPWSVAGHSSTIEVRAGEIRVMVDRETGRLSFADRAGNTFLREKVRSRKLTPDSAAGEPCFVAEQTFESPAGEDLFGLGQFQDGQLNLRNVVRRLTQVNSQIALPFLYSSKGYGLLWHQYGLTDFNPADSSVTLVKEEQTAAQADRTAEVTTTAGTQRTSQGQTLFSGELHVPAVGQYSLLLDLGDMDNRHLLLIDGKPCIDIQNFWLPPTACAKVNLTAGSHRVQVACKSTNSPRVSWRRESDFTTFRSPQAKELDYVVFFGPSADTVIAGYRKLSGEVPMLPRWAYGFWQCRERYASGQELVATVEEFRKRNIPMDVIVQDWQYWGKYGWGVMKFDEDRYPDPAGFIKRLHDLHARLSISVWENVDKNSAIGKEYMARNLYIPGSPWIDMLNPAAREFHWDELNQNLFAFGVDSWWMDATEPENDALKGKKTWLGPGDFYRLTYPLFVSQAVYEGQRRTNPGKRVCVLTRSAFPGQQRYGTINWSGDVGGTWDSFRRQIVAGLDYTITGMPFWTTDIGGFFRPGKSQYTDEKYHELLTRWYQWGAFNPVFRVHGYQSETEPWKYGPRVEESMRAMLTLRYRLLPYIYSEAWQVTRHGSTMMRPLVMDFRADSSARHQQYEYMFGSALLVAPVTEPEARAWKVYLPGPAAWYDFWTGKRLPGSQTAAVPAPLGNIPLLVRAGSIIPMGKAVQFADQAPADTLEVRVYPGADGRFELYEDEGDGYQYEQGRYATIVFQWNDRTRTLAIRRRQGDFPGCVKKRVFRIVLVSTGRGTGIAAAENVDRVAVYDGREIKMSFQ